MAKGKTTDNETIYKIMLSYVVTNNYSETARELNIPESTVRKIVNDNKDKEEFARLCEQKRDEFVAKADRIINKATDLLEERIDMALNNQEELDELIYEIWNAEKDEIKEQQKKSLVKKVMKMQINSLNEITTAIGTMYDKKALANGDPTSNEQLTINVTLSDEE